MSRQIANFAANLLGRSDSLTVVKQGIGITRQGNGNFAITLFSLYADGKHGQSTIGENFRSLAEAQALATRESARVYGGCKVAVASSALAA
jgi:uncharacterized protein YpbB